MRSAKQGNCLKTGLLRFCGDHVRVFPFVCKLHILYPGPRGPFSKYLRWNKPYLRLILKVLSPRHFAPRWLGFWWLKEISIFYKGTLNLFLRDITFTVLVSAIETIKLVFKPVFLKQFHFLKPLDIFMTLLTLPVNRPLVKRGGEGEKRKGL